MVKMIEKNIFEEDSEDTTIDFSINNNDNNTNTNNNSINKKSILKKRKKKYYNTPIDFINREIPDHIKE